MEPAGENLRDEESWFEITLVTANDAVDLLTESLAALGHAGSEVHELDGGETELRVFLQAPSEATAADGARRLEAALCSRAALAGLRQLDARVWREDWKRHFERTLLGARFEIFPPWDADAARAMGPGRLALVINPGMAFGTGRHETTAGCMELLETLVRPGDAVLDLGCGSGILAIAALKLGAKRIVAVDNDPDALRATIENAQANDAFAVEVLLADGPPANLEREFDVAVANILAEPLAEMAPRLTSCVRSSGALVLSGIESQRRALVEVAYSRQDWHVTRDIERSGWVSLALKRG
jgi:ribosomal protein L11 methyltransferase